jgi:3-methyladenine DNA glycosylase AlkD
MVATSAFIQRGELPTSFEIAECLLGDKQDLIHKAVGWMEREAGNCSRAEMPAFFLKRNYLQAPPNGSALRDRTHPRTSSKARA